MCICGKPETLGVVHSNDSPCFHYQAPDPRPDAFAREFFIAAISGNRAMADAASEKLLRYVLSTPPVIPIKFGSPSVSTDEKSEPNVTNPTEAQEDGAQDSPITY